MIRTPETVWIYCKGKKTKAKHVEGNRWVCLSCGHYVRAVKIDNRRS